MRAEAALRAGLASRGLPGAVYLDYADPAIMPTFGSKPCSAGVEGVKLSA